MCILLFYCVNIFIRFILFVRLRNSLVRSNRPLEAQPIFNNALSLDEVRADGIGQGVSLCHPIFLSRTDLFVLIAYIFQFDEFMLKFGFLNDLLYNIVMIFNGCILIVGRFSHETNSDCLFITIIFGNISRFDKFVIISICEICVDVTFSILLYRLMDIFSISSLSFSLDVTQHVL
jgi:hypothetical protein